MRHLRAEANPIFHRCRAVMFREVEKMMRHLLPAPERWMGNIRRSDNLLSRSLAESE